ncbi:hypothetical protein ACUHMQ_16980 [Chitinimonas sp. PSY-7]|uniref:hypothetical protein n=1 Tax=Chitinimonas sp. PSY-7 TaxID=3459088 RepID=UPI00403FFF39
MQSNSEVKWRRNVIATLLAAGLWGCGGGGDSSPVGSSTTTPPGTTGTVGVTTPPVQPSCPADYKQFDSDVYIIIGKSIPLSVGNGLFEFRRNDSSLNSSLKLCFGKQPEALVDGNLYILSDTFELIATGKDASVVPAEFQKLEDRKLTIDFKLDKVPTGVSSADMMGKITVYRLNPETKLLEDYATFSKGAGGISREINGSTKQGSVTVALNVPGRFVVAYKP